MADEIAEAAAMLGRILDAVKGGSLDVEGAEAKRLLQRIEGAQAALGLASRVGTGQALLEKKKL